LLILSSTTLRWRTGYASSRQLVRDTTPDFKKEHASIPLCIHGKKIPHFASRLQQPPMWRSLGREAQLSSPRPYPTKLTKHAIYSRPRQAPPHNPILLPLLRVVPIPDEQAPVRDRPLQCREEAVRHDPQDYAYRQIPRASQGRRYRFR
jgi:hypothetical protein